MWWKSGDIFDFYTNYSEILLRIWKIVQLIFGQSLNDFQWIFFFLCYFSFNFSPFSIKLKIKKLYSWRKILTDQAMEIHHPYFDGLREKFTSLFTWLVHRFPKKKYTKKSTEHKRNYENFLNKINLNCLENNVRTQNRITNLIKCRIF